MFAHLQALDTVLPFTSPHFAAKCSLPHGPVTQRRPSTLISTASTPELAFSPSLSLLLSKQIDMADSTDAPRRVSMAYILGFSNKPFKDGGPPAPPPAPRHPGAFKQMVSFAASMR